MGGPGFASCVTFTFFLVVLPDNTSGSQQLAFLAVILFNRCIWLLQRPLCTVVESLRLVLPTFGGCALLHVPVIPRVRWLHPLFAMTKHAASTFPAPRFQAAPAG